MYESLTAFIPCLEKGPYGRWPKQTGEGSPETPFVFPVVLYEESVLLFIDEVYRFAREHEETGLMNYGRILSQSNIIGLDLENISGIDVSSLDGITVTAIILGVIRGERQVTGIIFEYLESGCMQRLLRRLQYIDTTRDG